MRKKFTKKIMPLLMAGVLVLGGSLSNVSAKGNTGIGKIALSSTTSTVSYKEIKAKFTKAKSVHKEYYMGSELTNFTMTLEKNYSKYVL